MGICETTVLACEINTAAKLTESASYLPVNGKEPDAVDEGSLRQPANGCTTEHFSSDEGIEGSFTIQARLFRKLFSVSTEAKIWGVAARALAMPNPPVLYPEYTKPDDPSYVYRDLEFWTSGFSPGSLYLILERRVKYGHVFSSLKSRPHVAQLEHACKWWTENLHQNATLGATHDLGFMIVPWARPAWEICGDERAFKTMILTAKNLLSRFSPTVGCIRSWDICKTHIYDFQDTSKGFLVIIDNMMNLSLLFYVSEQTGDTKMRDAAIQHARTTARTHVRPDSSTTHLIVFDPVTGAIKDKLTNQGFSHTSCWARGQAWAIAGFMETYQWTREAEFLDTARRCADYFLDRLSTTYVSPWDFDAVDAMPDKSQPPDTSATMIAAYGMLLLHRAMLATVKQSHYLMAARRMAEAVCDQHLTPPAKYILETDLVDTAERGLTVCPSRLTVDMGGADTIVDGATINNFEFAPRRWVDHGLVYADYFFLLFGNELLNTNAGALIDRSL